MEELIATSKQRAQAKQAGLDATLSKLVPSDYYPFATAPSSQTNDAASDKMPQSLSALRKGVEALYSHVEKLRTTAASLQASPPKPSPPHPARRDEQTAPRKQQQPHGGHARYELTTTDGECATASATFSRPWAAPPFASPFAMTFPSTTSSASSSPLVVPPTVTPRMVLRSSSSSPPAPAPSSAPTAAPSADVWASSGVSAAAFGGAGFCPVPYRPRSVKKPVRGARSGRYRDLRWADALVGVVVPLAGGVLLLLGPAAAAPFSDPGVEGPGGSLSLSTPCMFAVGWGPDLVS